MGNSLHGAAQLATGGYVAQTQTTCQVPSKAQTKGRKEETLSTKEKLKMTRVVIMKNQDFNGHTDIPDGLKTTTKSTQSITM